MDQHNITPENSLSGDPGKNTHIPAFGNMNIELNTTQYEYEGVPNFPLELLPPEIVTIVTALRNDAGYNVDFTAVSMLYAAAIAMGGTYRVKIYSGWTEAATIYMALVAGPGIGKSHPLTFAVKPLYDADAKAYQLYQLEKAAFAEMQKTRKKEQKGEIEEPTLRKRLLSDYTIEALAVKHYDNLRGIAVCIDELAGWFKNFNRYNKGSEQEFWLSNWSGKTINIDRKSSEPIFIRNPFICVAGTIQPAVLNKMAAEDRGDNGFMDRVLFVAPEIQKEAWRDIGISSEVESGWANILNTLMALDYSEDGTPHIIPFSSKADLRLRQWQKQNTIRINEDDAYAPIGAKIEVYAPRLALIISGLRHASDGANMEEIGVDDVMAAIALAHYFSEMALRVRKALTGDPLAMVSNNKKALFNALPDKFTTANGVQIAAKLGVPERTAKRFFSDKKAFTRLMQGQYQKNNI